MNRTLLISIAICGTVLAGCGHGGETVVTGADGSKVTLSSSGAPTVVTGADGSKAVINGNQMDITGAHGEKTTITSNGNNSDMTVKGKDGTATYSQSGNTAKFKDDKGNSMETGASITEQDLGLPFYPGSTESPGGIKATSTGGKGMVSSTRTTTDDPSKILAFYTDKLGQPKSSSTAPTLIAASWEQTGKQITLMVDKSASPAKITLMVSTGK